MISTLTKRGYEANLAQLARIGQNMPTGSHYVGMTVPASVSIYHELIVQNEVMW